MAPPDNGNAYSDFRDLVALERLSSNVYRSTHLAFGPANGNRTYGGHVYMQSCYAASQTVAPGFVLHNITGWFLLAGKANERFIYTIRRLRDGGYTTRGVDVAQESNPDVICFTCTCSFKKPEKPSIPTVDFRQRIDLEDEYATVLRGKKPEEHQEMPGVDAPWYWDFSRRNNGHTDPFPGLELRKVDMTAYNASKAFDAKRNLKFYSVRGPLPSIQDDPNMHIAAHLYASDRNSLFVISNHLSINNNYSQIASLSHTVIFHATAAELDTTPSSSSSDDNNNNWFCQEAWTTGARQGRGTHHSRLWRRDGLLLATTLQDGMVRLAGGGGEAKAGFSPQGMERGMVGEGLRRGSREKL